MWNFLNFETDLDLYKQNSEDIILNGFKTIVPITNGVASRPRILNSFTLSYEY